MTSSPSKPRLRSVAAAAIAHWPAPISTKRLATGIEPIDLLLTMDRCAVLQSQVDRLTWANTSTRWRSQAPDEPKRAPFATQSAIHFDLAGEPSYEVVDI
jgi:hypothetical protein